MVMMCCRLTDTKTSEKNSFKRKCALHGLELCCVQEGLRHHECFCPCMINTLLMKIAMKIPGRREQD